jgi:hypothetical protein
MIRCVTDAGRSESAHKDEKLDCVVRALALMLNITYDEAWIVCSERRKPKHKTYGSELLFAKCGLFQHVMKWKEITEKQVKGIVAVKGHVFFFDGKHVHDLIRTKERVRVTCIWTF